MASSTVSPSAGSPFNTFEDSAVFSLLSFLSVAARRYGPAKVAAARRKITIIPASDTGRIARRSALREVILFIFPSPLAGVGLAGTAKTRLSTHAISLTLWKKKSCDPKWKRALTVCNAEVYPRAEKTTRKRSNLRGLAVQLNPTCPASGNAERSLAERNASTLHTS